MKEFFLTETKGGLVQGNDFGASNVATAYFDEVKKALPNAEQVTLKNLKIALAKGSGEETEIFLSKYSQQFKNELAVAYPAAKITAYDAF